MNKQGVSDPILFFIGKSGPAVSCADLSSASLHDTRNSQNDSSVVAEYLHPIVEKEASETSKGSNSCVRSYYDEKFNGLLPDKGSVQAHATNAAHNSENQVCLYSEEWWDGYAAGLSRGERMCRNCLSPIQKRRRVDSTALGYSPRICDLYLIKAEF